MEKDTPETTAFAREMYKSGVDCHHDGRRAIDFASKMESERDEARTVLKNLFEAICIGSDWDEGCLYYQGHSVPQLQGPLEDARKLLHSFQS